jgi:hypothetical protein
MTRAPAVLLGFLWLSAPGWALETPHEILACMARNEPQGSTVQTIVLRSIDRVGSESVSKATLYRRKQGHRSDLLMSFFEPSDLSGAALLIEERGPAEPAEMFLYVPALGRARRVSARGSPGPVLGTNFSFEDFEYLYGIARYGELQLGGEQEIDGRAVHVIEGHPPASDSAYARVVISVDTETCVPLRMEFFETGDRLRKRMEIDPEQVRSEGSARVPGSILMSDLRAETSSELIVEALEVDAEIPSQTFEPAWRSNRE